MFIYLFDVFCKFFPVQDHDIYIYNLFKIYIYKNIYIYIYIIYYIILITLFDLEILNLC